MKTLQIREAKAGFSGLIAAAEKGRPTLITRHGQPMAMVVPVEAGRRLYAARAPSLADYLLGQCAGARRSAPLPIKRDTTPLRDVDL